MSLPKILIIDDEEIILQSLSMLFGGEGIPVDTESSPVKAVERFTGENYSIVLVDIIMPQMKGEEVIRAIKKINPLCNVIVMTAYSSMAHVVECIEAGALDYVTKPFVEAELLLTVIRDAIARVERWRQSFGIDPARMRNPRRQGVADEPACQ